MAKHNLSIENQTRSQSLAKQVRTADNLFTRLRGLLFYPQLKPDQGLVLIPCKAVHCMGMKYSIDVIFINKNRIVVGLAANLRPGKFSPFFPAAHYCLEISEGMIIKTNTQIGDQLIFEITKTEG